MREIIKDNHDDKESHLLPLTSSSIIMMIFDNDDDEEEEEYHCIYICIVSPLTMMAMMVINDTAEDTAQHLEYIDIKLFDIF